MEFEKDKAMENASAEVHIPDYEKEIAGNQRTGGIGKL